MSIVVITGANRGIGLSLARAFVERGQTVVAACRAPSAELEALARPSGEAPRGELRIEPGVDVTDGASLRRLRQHLEGQTIGTLVANAGVLTSEGIERLDFEAVENQLAVNAVGVLRTVDALLPLLVSGSRIGIITSRMGSMADNTSGGSYGYRMSKAAVNAAGRSLAIDLGPRGIAVAILHPGYVRTDMTSHHGFMDPDESAALLLQRLDELTVANAGRFLHANGDELPW